ncbi:MAG TPA: 2-dehydropantoate 2-reductase [Paludibacter sp.]|nr:2-dehydropantoate 2-reductase [Paludibacter sp.]
MKTKIVIAGLGGVGGYFGGLLARRYADDPMVEIYFLARGEHLEKVRDNGLTLITETGTFIVHPALATDNVDEIGVSDYIILSTKSYDLEATVKQVKPLVGAGTVILPLLNGIDNSERIRALLPGVEVWDGCAYIVARKKEPGVVENSGKVHRLDFGYEYGKSDERLRAFEQLLRNAGIDATFHLDILKAIWTKFFFISSTATLTSYFNVGFRGLIDDENRKNTLAGILDELMRVARAENVRIDSDQVEKIIRQLEKLPDDSTASMHSDFLAGSDTELETLTGIVLRLGQKHGLPLPLYQAVYTDLRKRMNP